jgi:hypothetical protein
MRGRKGGRLNVSDEDGVAFQVGLSFCHTIRTVIGTLHD